MQKPVILTDIDDCCLDWISGFRMYASRVLNRTIAESPSDWSMQSWLGFQGQPDAQAKVDSMVEDFNHGSWEFGCLPPVNKAEKFLPLLAKDFNIIAITCCSVDPATVALRKANLYHVFGPIFQEVICQPLGTKKIDNLSKFRDRKVVAWVEDKAEAAVHGAQLGYPSFLVEQEHNKKFRAENPYGPVNHVRDWSDISGYIL